MLFSKLVQNLRESYLANPTNMITIENGILRWVAPIPVTCPNTDAGAPGPSLLGTGDGSTPVRASRERLLYAMVPVFTDKILVNQGGPQNP